MNIETNDFSKKFLHSLVNEISTLTMANYLCREKNSQEELKRYLEETHKSLEAIKKLVEEFKVHHQF